MSLTKMLYCQKISTILLLRKISKKIFSILNKHLFNNEIKFLPVVLWPMNKLVDKLNYHAKMSGDENEDLKMLNV